MRSSEAGPRRPCRTSRSLRQVGCALHRCGRSALRRVGNGGDEYVLVCGGFGVRTAQDGSERNEPLGVRVEAESVLHMLLSAERAEAEDDLVAKVVVRRVLAAGVPDEFDVQQFLRGQTAPARVSGLHQREPHESLLYPKYLRDLGVVQPFLGQLNTFVFVNDEKIVVVFHSSHPSCRRSPEGHSKPRGLTRQRESPFYLRPVPDATVLIGPLCAADFPCCAGTTNDRSRTDGAELWRDSPLVAASG